jgi:thioredoxin reductase (NADPH)
MKEQFHSKVVASQVGSFEPRKPLIEGINFYEKKESSISSKIQKNLEIKEWSSRGGDSALDWSIFLTDVASEVTLIHRRNEFRCIRLCRKSKN